MKGTVNGYAINSAGSSNWVIRALVVAVAAASVNVDQTRTTFGSALADANVVVSLTQSATIQGRATRNATAVASLTPTLIYSGASSSTASATGNGSVRRDVFGTAGGDATCTAEALTAQALGEASTTMASTVVLAEAHRIRPAASLRYGELSSSVSGDITRYTLIPTTNYGYAAGRGEASHKIYPNTYFNHDGYVLRAMAESAGETLQDRTTTIATIGSFEFCESEATSRSFIRYSARSLETGVVTRLQATPVLVYRGRVNATAEATITATATRNRFGLATATAEVDVFPLVARIRHATRASASAEAAVVTVAQKRTAFARASTTAESTVPFAILFGTQHRASVNQASTATGTGAAKQRFAGAVGAQLATVSVVLANAVVNRVASTNTVMASATVGRAFGLTNSEVLAPEERYLIVAEEIREMQVALEERTMMVTV